jgi:site-specific recombinase XerD
MILLAYKHGLRASEVCELKLSDVNLKTESINIERLKNSRHTVQSLEPHRGQPLLDEIAALKAWFRERQDDGSGVLFPSNKGGAMSRVQFFRLFKSIALAAGVSPEAAHPHSLKHSLCSHMVAENQNLALIQRAAGHKSISSTMQYVHVSDDQADAARKTAMMSAFSK